MAGGGMKLLILGHPRTGTLYTAIVLRMLGLDIGHEREGKDGMVSGIFGPNIDFGSFDKIIHQIKNPERAIPSITTIKGETLNLIYKTCGRNIVAERGKVKSRLLLAMLSWDCFTDWADSMTNERYRIEDIKEYWPKLLKVFGYKKKKFPPIPDNVNHINHKHFNYRGMKKVDKELTEKIKRKAEKYGYAV
jgi:hypothetical protein